MGREMVYERSRVQVEADIDTQPEYPQVQASLSARGRVVEARRVGKARRHRRKRLPPERLDHLLAVAPDLGVERRPARVEHAHHDPVAPAEAEPLADPRAVEALGDAPSHDDLGTARPERFRPEITRTCGRSARPSAPTPRTVTLVGTPVSRLGCAISTTTSFDAIDTPPGPIAISGWLSTIAACVRSTPLWISMPRSGA